VCQADAEQRTDELPRDDGRNSDGGNSPRSVVTSETTRLKCSPLMGAEHFYQHVQLRHGGSGIREEGDRDVPPATRSPVISRPTTTASRRTVPNGRRRLPAEAV
jgi:hypothetical protein